MLPSAMIDYDRLAAMFDEPAAAPAAQAAAMPAATEAVTSMKDVGDVPSDLSNPYTLGESRDETFLRVTDANADFLAQQGFEDTPGFFQAGGTLDKLATMSNPALGMVDLPPVLKALSTVKVSGPGGSFGAQAPSAGKRLSAAMLKRVAPTMLRTGRGAGTGGVDDLAALFDEESAGPTVRRLGGGLAGLAGRLAGIR